MGAPASASWQTEFAQNCTYGSICWTAPTRLSGPTIHPTCQPVALKVLPALLIVKVRSYIPGRLAKCTCPGTVVSKEVSLGGLWIMNL